MILNYISVLSALITAHMMKGNYAECLSTIKTLEKVDSRGSKELDERYFPFLDTKIKILALNKAFVYYKEKNEDRYQLIKRDILEENNNQKKLLLQ